VSVIPSNTDIKKKNFFGKKNKKTFFIISLVVAILIENSVILYVPLESKIIYTNWILLTNSSVGAGLALLLVINIIAKQKILNTHSTTHIALAIGLVLWLCANIQWIQYENQEIVPDIPSVADLLWLSAYPFLGYSLYLTFKKFHKIYRNNKIFLMSILCGIFFIASIVYITINLGVFSTSKGMALFSIMIAYPVLNTMLIVPAIVMFIGFKKEPESSIPRICESLSLINLVIADSWFAIIFLSNLIETVWFSNLLIVDHYLIISAGLLWSLLFLFPITFKSSRTYRKCLVFSHKISKKIPLVPSILVVVIPTLIFSISFYPSFFSYSYTNDIYSIDDSRNISEIKIGTLLGLSGVSSERGKTQKSAIEEAVKDVNKYFSELKTEKRYKVVLNIDDTERNPDIAVAKLKNLVDKGVRIIIGPSTSSELKAIKKHIDENNLDVLIISHSSTSPSLSTKDNIFRLVQNDNNQGKEIAKKMWNDGIRLVVPIWRDDSYGNELYNAMKVNFEKLGGNVSEEGVTYDPHVGKFAASLHRINFIMWDQELKSLSVAVSNAINSSLSIDVTKEKQNFSTSGDSNAKVGVYIIAYGEIIPILLQAPSHIGLDSVRWYGSDGIAKNERLLDYHDTMQFISKTKFVTPLMSLDHNIKEFESLENNTGLELNSYDANAYDALWIAALTESKSDGCINIEKLKENFNNIINSYSGSSGKIKLDEKGDRIGNYDFWMVLKNQSPKDYKWEKIYSYY
jgi:ABC-type branched-subunit amino acid transport system substrate-binding protein